MIKIFDDVLTPQELENFASDMNRFVGKIVCPHTDRVLNSKIIGDSLNKLRPRANCLMTEERKFPISNNLATSAGPRNAMKAVLDQRGTKMHDTAHFGQWVTKKHFPVGLKKIISKAPVKLKGVEWWCYDSVNAGKDGAIAVPKHTDYDGGLEMLTGEVVCPEVTYIYYDRVDEDLKGGELVVYDTDNETIIETITPKENRLIIFSGGLPHEVLRFTGNRRSFVILPWKNRPREFL